MTKEFLKQVTVTGADDSVNYRDLYRISKEFPFVEWGILLSKNNEGSPRFPTRIWLNNFLGHKPEGVKISGHICGSWVRDIVSGGVAFRVSIGQGVLGFDRFQLNFHAQSHPLEDAERFIRALVLLTMEGKQQVIFQRDSVNDMLYRLAVGQNAKDEGIDAVSLFDTSGGAGLLPQDWAAPTGEYCGYAGGLSPTNLVEQLGKIKKVVSDSGGYPVTIWIDAETHLRSHSDEVFDLGKVMAFLQAAKPFVVQSCLRG